MTINVKKRLFLNNWFCFDNFWKCLQSTYSALWSLRFGTFQMTFFKWDMILFVNFTRGRCIEPHWKTWQMTFVWVDTKLFCERDFTQTGTYFSPDRHLSTIEKFSQYLWRFWRQASDKKNHVNKKERQFGIKQWLLFLYSSLLQTANYPPSKTSQSLMFLKLRSGKKTHGNKRGN